MVMTERITNFLIYLFSTVVTKTIEKQRWYYQYAEHNLNTMEGLYPGGGLPYESDGDARRKIRIKPLKETNLGVVQALFDP